jgi:hypothetical protein
VGNWPDLPEAEGEEQRPPFDRQADRRPAMQDIRWGNKDPARSDNKG